MPAWVYGCAEMANIATLLRELKVNNKGTRKRVDLLGIRSSKA